MATSSDTIKIPVPTVTSRDCPSPVFPWSPVPPHREPMRRDIYRATTSNDNNNDLYPNCDASIWLRSCEQEIPDPIDGHITGEIPVWLEGALLRNGPGSLKVGDMMFDHLFDSSALLHRFAIKNQRVTYQCRFLQTETYKRNHLAQRIVVTEFGTRAVPDPCQSIFDRVGAFFHPGELQSDNAMISIYPFDDELYAFTETPVITRFNPDTLETEGKVNVYDYVGIVNHTSHPHVMSDGTVFNLGMTVTKTGPVHNIVCFPSGAGKGDTRNGASSMFDRAHIVASVPSKWMLHPSYMHTFGVTENYFLIVEQPLSVSVPRMVKNQLEGEAFGGALQWYPDEMTRIHVINRHTGALTRTFNAEAFFYLHIINQYELFDHIVIDICCYRDASMLGCMYVDVVKNMQKIPNYAKMFRGRPFRFVLPLRDPESNKIVDMRENLVNLPNTNAKAHLKEDGSIYVKPEMLCNIGCETPRINYDCYLGKPYQYFYAISSDVDAQNPGTIIKVNCANKTCATWCEDNCYPSEPIFVARPNGSDEDDGVILSALVWGQNTTHKCGLLVLDAKTMTEIARAEFESPGPVPKCLHGWFTNKHGEFGAKKENI